MKGLEITYEYYLKESEFKILNMSDKLFQILDKCIEYYTSKPKFEKMQEAKEAAYIQLEKEENFRDLVFLAFAATQQELSDQHYNGELSETRFTKLRRENNKERKEFEQISGDKIDKSISSILFSEPTILHYSSLEHSTRGPKYLTRKQEWLIKNSYDIYGYKEEALENIKNLDSFLKENYNYQFSPRKIMDFRHELCVNFSSGDFDIDEFSIIIKPGYTDCELWYSSIQLKVNSALKGIKKSCEAALKDVAELIDELFDLKQPNKHYNLEVS